MSQQVLRVGAIIYADGTPQCGDAGKRGADLILRQGFKKPSSFLPVERPRPRGASRALRARTPLLPDGIMSPPIVTVTRLLRFNAAHRVHNPALSDEENTALFGKCNNPNWHGHNYVLEVTVAGEIDARTGYVIDLGKLRAIVEREVVDQVDHRNMNLEVPFLSGTNPTAENIVVACWRVLEPAVAPGRLARLRLWETENNSVEYEGR